MFSGHPEQSGANKYGRLSKYPILLSAVRAAAAAAATRGDTGAVPEASPADAPQTVERRKEDALSSKDKPATAAATAAAAETVAAAADQVISGAADEERAARPGGPGFRNHLPAALARHESPLRAAASCIEARGGTPRDL